MIFLEVFFSNSGAEANEGAIKLAKIYFYKKGVEKYEIISLDHSFHGRTLATVAATGQEKYQKPYKPLTPGFGTFDNAHLYSLVYNGSYMIPNMILALLLAGVLYVPLKSYFAGRDLLK